MKIYFAAEQQRHDSGEELVMGSFRPAMDTPVRAKLILEKIASMSLGTAVAPASSVPRELLVVVHDPDFLDFIQHLARDWDSQYPNSKALPEMGIAPTMRRILPGTLRGKLSYYCFDTCTAVVPGTWEAVLASGATAVAGAQAIASGELLAYSLCRPPGHHAGRDFYGGYCFLNNAALAAQKWIEGTGTPCAILDVDFHHGNGTQAIFYERGDAFYVSIHASPTVA
jgi:acetoin utilization deacetylase AcuC-like enzyme